MIIDIDQFMNCLHSVAEQVYSGLIWTTIVLGVIFAIEAIVCYRTGRN